MHLFSRFSGDESPEESKTALAALGFLSFRSQGGVYNSINIKKVLDVVLYERDASVAQMVEDRQVNGEKQ